MANFDNPFADPSVKDASKPLYPAPDDDFNPFAQQQKAWHPAPETAAPIRGNIGVEPTQPAPIPAQESAPPLPPAAYTSWATSAAADDLRRRQEELEQKAAELARREQEMQRNLQFQARQNNFPPLPSWFPLQPCFFVDIVVDIPVDFQKTVRMTYYFWLAYIGLLLLNVLGSLTYFIAAMQHGVDGKSGVTFGLSLLYLAMFAPCSFVCWFRPAYKAFQLDSSFNFFVFFFIFFFQFCVLIMQCLGIDGWGTVGILTSLMMFSNQAVGAKAAGAVMFIIGVLFGVAAGVSMLLLLKIHRIYRNTGASFAKAQQEFSQGVMTNRTVQQAAGNMAASAARSTVQQTFGADNR